jgi:hypothetical protein
VDWPGRFCQCSRFIEWAIVGSVNVWNVAGGIGGWNRGGGDEGWCNGRKRLASTLWAAEAVNVSNGQLIKRG